MKASVFVLAVVAAFTTMAVRAQDVPMNEIPAPQRASLYAPALGYSGDEVPRLRRSTAQRWSDGAWMDDERITYTYGDGENVERLEQEWDSTAWVNVERRLDTIVANGGGTLTERRYEVWQDGSWVPTTRSLYTDSGDGFVFGRDQAFDDGVWYEYARIAATVRNTRTITEDAQRRTEDGWVPHYRFFYTSQGDSTIHNFEVWNEAEFVPAERVIFPGSQLDEVLEHGAEQHAVLESEHSYTLVQFTTISNITEEWDSTGWVGRSREDVERDAFGRVVAVSFYNWSDGAWSLRQTISGEYDEEGRLVKTRNEYTSGTLIETYDYDASGLVESVLWQAVQDTSLANVRRTVFEWTNVATAIEDDELPAQALLESIYPNPFNPAATVRYRLAAPEHIRIRAFDVTGRLVATLVDGVQSSGDHAATFEAGDLASGVYVIRLETSSIREARSVSLVR